MKSNKRKNMRGAVQGIISAAAIGWLCCAVSTTALAQTAPANLSPDLQEVVKLAQQKMSDDIITSYIKNTGHTYKLGADDIIYLNSQGVSQAVIGALMATAANPSAPTGQTPPTTPTPAPDANAAPQPPPLDAGSAPAPAPASEAPSTPPPVAANPGYAAPPPMAAPAGLQDMFYQEGGLNPALWTAQGSVLAGISYMGGHPVGTTLEFSPAGMHMSGVRDPGQFMGIQSMASYAAPFSFSTTVTGQAQNGIPFEVFLVSGDLQQWVSVAGHLGGRGGPRGAVDVGGPFGGVRFPIGGGRTPEYGVWVNHTGTGLPISSLGYKIFEDPIAGIPYTIQISVGADGGAAIALLDAGRGLIAAQNVPVGTGPFYVVLAGRDGHTHATWQSVQLVPTAPPVAEVAPAPAPAAPAAPTMDYFQAQLAPYGNWINLPQYGPVWQPAVDPTWRPYVDGGSWTYTDAGWYWNSDYPWGDIAFHYGRWAYTVSGWVWVPGYDYAPAWVVWRHDDADGVLGWAPLPPGALFVDGGWRYNGVNVGADFDFGIGAGFFCFVDGGHFWDRDFRRYAVPHDRLVFVFGHSAFDDHFRYDHGHFMNVGIDVGRMARLTHRDVGDFRPRPFEEIRRQEEQHHMEARRDDVRGFHAGDHPDARGFHGGEHPDARGAAHGENHGAEPGRGPAENNHGGAPAGHAPVENAHGAAPTSHPSAPAAGGSHGATSTPKGSSQGGGKDEHPH